MTDLVVTICFSVQKDFPWLAEDNQTMAPGNLERFELVFSLTSTVDPNYLHIHTLKGIAQAATGPWTQYMGMDVACDELPCMIPYPVRCTSAPPDICSVLGDACND